MMDYDKIISEKCRELKPSGIRKFFDIAANMKGVISLGVGEPDFQTPWAIRRAAIAALEKGKTVYTANAGLIELRRSICNYIKRKINVEYEPSNELIITVGGSEAIDLGIRALVNPGDEVLIETKAENGFKLTAEELKAKITDKTKLLILPFPNNPTGAIMTREELEPIAEVLRGTNIMVLSDEIYSELTYDGRHVSITELDGMKERTLLVNGFSKAFAMTGWRLGYLAGPEPIVKQMLKIHQYAIMCSPTVSQYAAVEAMSSCDGEVAKMVNEYNIRRRWLVNALNEIGLTCFEPKGAFYVFPSIKSTGLSSQEFCEQLLYKHNVAVVPGDAFGECGEGHIRISYAYSLKHLMEAVERISEFLDELKGRSV